MHRQTHRHAHTEHIQNTDARQQKVVQEKVEGEDEEHWIESSHLRICFHHDDILLLPMYYHRTKEGGAQMCSNRKNGRGETNESRQGDEEISKRGE